MSAAVTDILSRVWIFGGLTQSELLRLSRIVSRRTYAPRSSIVQKGEPATEFFVLLRGRAKVVAPGHGGIDAALNVMAPGEVFGEIAVLDGQRRSATVIALDECEIAIVRKEAFHELLAASPSIALKLLSVLAGRVRKLTTQLEDRAFLEVPARLAKQLLWLAENHGVASGSGIRIDLKLSQQEIGDLIGATRESVNKHFREWVQKGVIRQERQRVRILDLDALRAISGAASR